MDYYPKTYLSRWFSRRKPRRLSMGKSFNGSVYEWLYNLRFAFGGVMIVGSVFLAALIISSLEMEQVHARAADSSAKTPPASMSNSPNVVTNGMSQAAHKLEQGMMSTGYAALSGAHTTATVIADGGIVVARGVQTGVTVAAVGTGKAIVAVGKGVGSAVATSAGFVFGIPGNIAGFVSGTSVIESAIRPSGLEEIPIIDPDSPELFAAITALPPEPSVRATNTQDAQGPIWPINGRVTAEFGIPHWPYQPTHTGIDISSGQPAGVTPVKSFRPGTVKDTVHTNRGLGNHVIVDHGNGVTSVYAHLDSIAVRKGQKVDINTTLGLEGTTGLSTGPHLHFEIRVHGQVTNPRQFINGNP